MKAKSRVIIRDSFQNLEIKEPGLFKSLGYNELSGKTASSFSFIQSMENISYNNITQFYELLPNLGYATGYSLSGEDGILGWRTTHSTSPNNQNLRREFLTFPLTTSASFPLKCKVGPALSTPVTISFIEIQKHFKSIKNTVSNLYVFSCNLEGNKIGIYDTLLIVLPNDTLPYWTLAVGSEINKDNVESVLTSNNDLNKTNCVKNYFCNATLYNSLWLNGNNSLHFYTKIVEDELWVYGDLLNSEPIKIKLNAEKYIREGIFLSYVTEPGPFSFRYGGYSYPDEGYMDLKIPVGYNYTSTPEVNYKIFRSCLEEYFAFEDNIMSNIEVENEKVEGQFFYCRLKFSVGVVNGYIKYSPMLKRINVVIPPVYEHTTNNGDELFIENETINWSISKELSGSSTCTINIDNNQLTYSLPDIENLIGKQVRILSGYDEEKFYVKFTGIINDVEVKRESNISCSINLSVGGFLSRLESTALVDREYDGNYHQDVIRDLCLMAQIPNILTEDPLNDFDKLGYGLNDPKYKLNIGDTFKTMVDNVLEFSGFVLDEDEYGNIIYANDRWRDLGIGQYTISGEINPDLISVGVPVLLTSENHFSSISISINENNLRNTVIVIGVADKYIPESPEGLYPEYNQGDYIIAIRENERLIQQMGRKFPLVIKKPEYNSPEACMFTAETMLAILAESYKMCSITSIAMPFLFVGQTIQIQDLMLFNNVKYLSIENISENFSNGVYNSDISGRLLDFPPVNKEDFYYA